MRGDEIILWIGFFVVGLVGCSPSVALGLSSAGLPLLFSSVWDLKTEIRFSHLRCVPVLLLHASGILFPAQPLGHVLISAPVYFSVSMAHRGADETSYSDLFPGRSACMELHFPSAGLFVCAMLPRKLILWL